MVGLQIDEERVTQYTALGVSRGKVLVALSKYPEKSKASQLEDYLFTGEEPSEKEVADIEAQMKGE